MLDRSRPLAYILLLRPCHIGSCHIGSLPCRSVRLLSPYCRYGPARSIRSSSSSCVPHSGMIVPDSGTYVYSQVIVIRCYYSSLLTSRYRYYSNCVAV